MLKIAFYFFKFFTNNVLLQFQNKLPLLLRLILKIYLRIFKIFFVFKMQVDFINFNDFLSLCITYKFKMAI